MEIILIFGQICRWLERPIVDILDIPKHIHSELQMKVASYISNAMEVCFGKVTH